MVPDKHRSLGEGAVEPWNRPHYRAILTQLRRFARRRGVPLDVPWSFLEEGHRRLVLEGDEEFPPRMSVLFERSIEETLAADAIWGLVNRVSTALLTGRV